VSVGESAGSRFAERLDDEGREFAAAAAARGLTLRLMGDVGIRLALGEAFDPAHERRYGDLDVIIRRRDARGVEALLAELPLAESLDRPGPSLSVTDLLMTKLRIVELNAKDRSVGERKRWYELPEEVDRASDAAA
jgi:hypothetical protein